ncbi:hypothetical protein ACO1O0_007096 [Amphichorda felina]
MSSLELGCENLNTTECILRAATSILDQIKQSDSEYNWDGLTFASTVVIGVVALFFAGLTIGQGLIAAGPGRPKCSKYALGPWAQLSRRLIDWSELRYQSVAYTPVIRIARLLRVAWPDQEGWDDELDEATLRLLSSYNWATRTSKLTYKPKNLDDYFPATWLSLLTRAGLDHPGLWDLKPARGDYIPSDLAVAPAYASTRDIITIFALVSFPHRLQILQSEDSKVTSVRGKDLDLDFRQHALLGTYGVFQTFGTPERHERWYGKGAEFLLNKVDPLALRVLLHANGYIPQSRIMGNALPVGLDHTMYSLEGIQHTERQRDRERSRLQVLCKQCKCCRDDDQNQCCGGPHRHRPNWCMLGGLMNDIGILGTLNVDDAGLDLLAAEAPHAIPILFPKKSMGIGEKVRSLLLLSRLWSLGGPPPLAGRRPKNTPWTGEEDMLLSPYEPKDPSRERRSFYADKIPFNMCRQHAAGIGWSASPTDLDIDKLPRGVNKVRAEVARLDGWLEKNVQEHVLRCRWLSLSCASAALAELGQSPDHGFTEHFPWNIDVDSTDDTTLPIKFPSSEIGSNINGMIKRISRFRSWNEQNPHDRNVLKLIFGLYKDSSVPPKVTLSDVTGELYKFLDLWQVDDTGDTFVYSTNMVQHPLDDLLIYRAVLISVLFNVAADNSEIVENEVHQKIIPIL